MKAHKDGLTDQIAHILADGVKQGAFEIADTKVTARAIFDATVTASIIRPMPTNGAIRSCRRGSTP